MNGTSAYYTAGNVGIGTSSAISTLTVSRNGATSVSSVDSSSTAHLNLIGADAKVRLQLGTGNSLYSTYAGWIQASYDNGGGSNGVEALLLNPIGGNVNIGYQGDAGYKLSLIHI